MTADSGFGTAHLTAGQRRLAVLVVLLAFFMDILDATIVNVALPSIEHSLNASASAIQWIIAGYMLAFALFLITGGRMGDIFGYKRMFLAGMAAFTLASLACGFSGSTEILIAARFIQGMAAALMVPQIMSTIQILYPNPKDRQIMSAFYGALAGIASVVGPVVGAALIAGDSFGLGWRAIFLVNVPVGVVSLIAAMLLLPDSRSPHPLKLDLFGVALTLVAMMLLLYPLIQGRELGWPLWTFVSMVLSVPVFVLFAWLQVRRDRRDGSPLVVPGLFLRRSFLVGALIAAFFFAAIGGFFLVLSIFLQSGAGFSVIEAGLTGVPFSIAVAVTSGMSGPLITPRFGRSTLTAGALVMAVGLAALAMTVYVLGTAVTPWTVIPQLVVAGLGMGLVVSPIFAFVLSDVPIRDAGSASGLISAIEQVAGAIGVAVVGLVFFAPVATGQKGGNAEFSLGMIGAVVVCTVLMLVVAVLTRFLPDRVLPGARKADS